MGVEPVRVRQAATIAGAGLLSALLAAGPAGAGRIVAPEEVSPIAVVVDAINKVAVERAQIVIDAGEAFGEIDHYCESLDGVLLVQRGSADCESVSGSHATAVGDGSEAIAEGDGAYAWAEGGSSARATGAQARATAYGSSRAVADGSGNVASARDDSEAVATGEDNRVTATDTSVATADGTANTVVARTDSSAEVNGTDNRVTAIRESTAVAAQTDQSTAIAQLESSATVSGGEGNRASATNGSRATACGGATATANNGTSVTDGTCS